MSNELADLEAELANVGSLRGLFITGARESRAEPCLSDRLSVNTKRDRQGEA
jgi:hypothetical protein